MDLNKFFAEISKNFATIRCENCQYEGPTQEFHQGCPRCREKVKLVPISANGLTPEQLGMRKKYRQSFRLMIASALILFIAYKLLSYNYFLAVLILVLAFDLIMLRRRKNDL